MEFFKPGLNDEIFKICKWIFADQNLMSFYILFKIWEGFFKTEILEKV